MSLNLDSFPVREIRKGRELAWDPYAIDFSKEREHWSQLNDREQKALLIQVVGFYVGERAVTHDLAPLQQALRREPDRLDEEMYITQQMFEETTHVEFFKRWMNEGLPGKLGVDIPFPTGKPSVVLHKLLPEAMTALNEDRSPRAQICASVMYHQIVEGVLAELGYEVFYAMLDPRDLMPGLREGVRNIQRDEARHIAFGTYFCQRVIRENPDMESFFVEEMDAKLDVVLEANQSFFEAIGDPAPFDLEQERFDKLIRTLHRRRREAVLSGSLVEA